jgi:hypothetical protein
MVGKCIAHSNCEIAYRVTSCLIFKQRLPLRELSSKLLVGGIAGRYRERRKLARRYFLRVVVIFLCCACQNILGDFLDRIPFRTIKSCSNVWFVGCCPLLPTIPCRTSALLHMRLPAGFVMMSEKINCRKMFFR